MAVEFQDKYLGDVVRLLAASSKIYLPFQVDSGQSSVAPFGYNQTTSAFQTFWNVTTTDGTDVKMVAMMNGTLSLNEVNSKQFVLVVQQPVTQFAWQSKLPSWFPMPYYIFYENIDAAKSRQYLIDYLNANSTALRTVRKNIQAQQPAYASATVESIVDNFLALTVTFPTGTHISIPIEAGTEFAIAETSELHVTMKRKDDFEETRFVDPAIYTEHLSSYFVGLDEHANYDQLTVGFGGIVANGTYHFVFTGGRDGGTTELEYDLEGTIAAASDYDTIIIDTGTYTIANELLINKPITITSLADASAVESDGSPSGFPVFSADGGTGRIMVIIGVTDIVSISRLIIRDANYTHTSPNNGTISCGGAILIEYTDTAYIANCVISNNTIDAALDKSVLSGMSLDNILALVQQHILNHEGIDGSGGGVATYNSSAYIYSNLITNNSCVTRGGGICNAGAGWSVISKNTVISNTARDGGGIAVEIALPKTGSYTNYADNWILSLNFDETMIQQAKSRFVRIYDNIIDTNNSTDDGGGIYASVLSRLLLEGNTITNNTAYGQGGGLRNSYGSPVISTNDTFTNNIANTGNAGMAGGGGIATSSSSLVLKGALVTGNVCLKTFAGGVLFASKEEKDLYMYSSSYTYPISYAIDLGFIEITGSTTLTISITVGPETLDIDWDSILNKVFGVTSASLEIDSDTEIYGNTVAKLDDDTSEDGRKAGGLFVYRYYSDDPNNPILQLSVSVDDVSKIYGNYVNGTADHVTFALTGSDGYSAPSVVNYKIEDFYQDDTGEVHYESYDQDRLSSEYIVDDYLNYETT